MFSLDVILKVLSNLVFYDLAASILETIKMVLSISEVEGYTYPQQSKLSKV